MNHHAIVLLLCGCIFESIFQTAQSYKDMSYSLIDSYYLYYEIL